MPRDTTQQTELYAMPAMMLDDDLIITEQAARLLGVKPQTLIAWRTLGRYDVPYCKVGRAVRYSRRDLEAWLASRRTTATTRLGDDE